MDHFVTWRYEITKFPRPIRLCSHRYILYLYRGFAHIKRHVSKSPSVDYRILAEILILFVVKGSLYDVCVS